MAIRTTILPPFTFILYLNFLITSIVPYSQAISSPVSNININGKRKMTVSTIPNNNTITIEENHEKENDDLCLVLPDWVEEMQDSWGTPLRVHEWDDTDSFRSKNGWHGEDLVHARHAPVCVLEYFVQYGNGIAGVSASGGVDTALTGIVHFTKRAESHKGFCHGGSMCSLMDDIIGWCAFLTTGTCLAWSGFTVQVNTQLKKPIRVGSYLLVRARITKVERRKVSVIAELIDPSETDDNSSIHATGEGLVILNKGVLPEEPTA